MENLLQAFADAWNGHDVDALMSMMTTDCVFEASGGNAVNGERHEGQQAVRAAYTAVFAQYPGTTQVFLVIPDREGKPREVKTNFLVESTAEFKEELKSLLRDSTKQNL